MEAQPPTGGGPPPKKLRVHDPPLFTYPLSIFVLAHSNMDSSHNLRMIHEGRTIATILVSAGVDSSCSGSSLPGPAVVTYSRRIDALRFLHGGCRRSMVAAFSVYQLHALVGGATPASSLFRVAYARAEQLGIRLDRTLVRKEYLQYLLRFEVVAQPGPVFGKAAGR